MEGWQQPALSGLLAWRLLAERGALLGSVSGIFGSVSLVLARLPLWSGSCLGSWAPVAGGEEALDY